MAKQVARRRGSAANHGSFIGTAGEITVDTTNNRPVIHDGALAGGYTGVMRDDIFVNGYPAISDVGGIIRFNSSSVQTQIRTPDNVGAFIATTTASSVLMNGINPQLTINPFKLDILDSGNNVVLRAASGNAIIGQGTRLSTSTEGFPYIPMITGVPVSNPTTVNGFCPIAINTGNMKLFLHNPTGKWWSVQMISQ